MRIYVSVRELGWAHYRSMPAECKLIGFATSVFSLSHSVIIATKKDEESELQIAHAMPLPVLRIMEELVRLTPASEDHADPFERMSPRWQAIENAVYFFAHNEDQAVELAYQSGFRVSEELGAPGPLWQKLLLRQNIH